MVPKLLYQIATRQPDHIAIYDGYGAITYQSLADLVKKTKEALQEEGIRPGMGVGVMGKNSHQFIAMVFAVMDCGAVVMPVSNQLKAAEVAEIIKTARLHAILDDQSGPLPSMGEERGKGLKRLKGGKGLKEREIELVMPNGVAWRLSFNPVVSAEETFAPHVENPALIRFTSGTTGISKGVILSHQSIAERTEAANKVLKLGPEDTVIWVLSMAYHFVVSIILYLRYGCTIVVCDSFIADTIIEMTNRHKGTFFYGSPMHIRLLASDRSMQMLPSLKTVISTSTGISQAQCEAFYQRFNIPVSQAYGIIEVGLPIINFEKSKTAPEAVGYALPDYEVEILNDTGAIQPPEVVGHLAMRGPGMFDAYLEPPKGRGEVMENGWFMTGDLASKQKDGLIKIEGRKKSMINVSGNKVFPEEVEAVLNQHEAVRMSRVSGFQHRFLGECVQAEVILENGHEVDIEALISFCRERLSTYKVPQKIQFVAELPMTDSGKLLRM